MRRKSNFTITLFMIFFLFVSCNLSNVISHPDTKGWDSIHYTGAYQFIADDTMETRYPIWTIDKKTETTTYGDLRIPKEWRVEKTNSNIVLVVDTKGQSMIEIGIKSFLMTDPFFNVKPNHCDPIKWEQMNSKAGYDIYAFTLETDETTQRNTIVIKKIIYIISDKKGVYNNIEFNYGYYISFNKAYINVGIQYIISNQDINVIVNSFLPKGFN